MRPPVYHKSNRVIYTCWLRNMVQNGQLQPLTGVAAQLPGLSQAFPA
jgi:hypothetical protein